MRRPFAQGLIPIRYCQLLLHHSSRQFCLGLQRYLTAGRDNRCAVSGEDPEESAGYVVNLHRLVRLGLVIRNLEVTGSRHGVLIAHKVAVGRPQKQSHTGHTQEKVLELEGHSGAVLAVAWLTNATTSARRVNRMVRLFI